jgi:aryl-alcohol dehydrogenase-like predicted oxidoreductase
MRLALGTANFATRYGIANKEKPSDSEIQRILDTARRGGIKLIDTAKAYGCDIKMFDGFDVINKINTSTTSLPPSYALLSHGSGADMMEIVMAKHRGIVKKIGAAIYNPEEMPSLIAYPIDIMQIPYNVFDMRFAPHINFLQDMGIEVHIRSAFLQGLLLMDSPPIATAQVRRFHRTARAFGYTPAQYALGRVLACGADVAVVGVNNAEQLEELLEFKPIPFDGYNFEVRDENIINPVNWRLIN